MAGDVELRFDLVVATVDRTDSLAALLDSLAAQTYEGFRLVTYHKPGLQTAAP